MLHGEAWHASAMTAIAIALASVLLALSVLHVFWAIRNRFTSSVVIPKVNGRPAFIPSRASSIAVACALAVAAFIALAQGHVVAFHGPAAPLRWAAYAAGLTFTARAIGDFRLVGFFKRIKGTDFARWDYFLFAPLCTLIGASFLYLAQR
jgi:hypothetical protein